MSPLDVLMYRGESDPSTRTSMIGLYLFDRTPRLGRRRQPPRPGQSSLPATPGAGGRSDHPADRPPLGDRSRFRHRPPRPASPGPGSRLVPRRPRPRRDVAHGPARHHPPAVGIHAGRGRRGWPRRADHEDEPHDHRRRGRDAAAVRPVRHRPGPGPATACARAHPGRPHPARHHRRGAAPAADHGSRHRRRPRGRCHRGRDSIRFATAPRVRASLEVRRLTWAVGGNTGTALSAPRGAQRLPACALVGDLARRPQAGGQGGRRHRERRLSGHPGRRARSIPRCSRRSGDCIVRGDPDRPPRRGHRASWQPVGGGVDCRPDRGRCGHAHPLRSARRSGRRGPRWPSTP